VWEINNTYRYNEEEGPPPLLPCGGPDPDEGPVGGADGNGDEVVVVEDIEGAGRGNR